MKVVLLAGGFGTRISEESGVRPKPMVEIGGRPILWHIMKIYSHYGLNDFVICCGYKGYMIKNTSATISCTIPTSPSTRRTTKMRVHSMHSRPWKVTLVDTGELTLTGGRIKRIRDYVDNQTFCLTYGDGVSDVNINELIMHHQNMGQLATLTSVRQHGRWGLRRAGRIQDPAISRKARGTWRRFRPGSMAVSLSWNPGF
ncbi:MAG: NTP transferase domain-containing protein [Bacteroidales bacterium]